MTRNKDLTNIRAKKEVRDKINTLARELSFVEEKEVRVPEVLRRTFNIDNLKNVLKEDAKAKKKLGEFK